MCPTCKKFRSLSGHLFELSEYCRFLDNESKYKRHGQVRVVKTKVISDWLKLASQLEKVEIDAWKFTDDSSSRYCRPVADEHDSNSKHFTAYSTVLTRFMFISNALEETYRFVDRFYLSSEGVSELPENKKLREASLRATTLADNLASDNLPKYFKHIVNNLHLTFEYYCSELNPALTGMSGVEEDQNSYGLHIVRNIRNHIAHGVFPIIDNPEYWGEEETRDKLIALLFHASRVSCLYIQALIFKYNNGFQSDDYSIISEMNWDEETYFIDNCKVELALQLHIDSDFSFESPVANEC